MSYFTVSCFKWLDLLYKMSYYYDVTVSWFKWLYILGNWIYNNLHQKNYQLVIIRAMCREKKINLGRDGSVYWIKSSVPIWVAQSHTQTPTCLCVGSGHKTMRSLGGGGLPCFTSLRSKAGKDLGMSRVSFGRGGSNEVSHFFQRVIGCNRYSTETQHKEYTA